MLKEKNEMYEQCSENPKKAIQSVENVENEKQCGKNPEDTNLGVNVLFRRRGIMQSKSQQRVLRLGPSLLQQRNAVTVRKG
jgi:hypothetical protein